MYVRKLVGPHKQFVYYVYSYSPVQPNINYFLNKIQMSVYEISSLARMQHVSIHIK